MNKKATYSSRRPKAGEGKLPYGLTCGALASVAAVRAIKCDTSVQLELHARNMYRFTLLHIDLAQDLAKAGNKDQARDWFRFFNNSQILSVLENFPMVGDVAVLRESLKMLGRSCHPHDEPSFTNDLSAIRACLKEILSHVENKASASAIVSRFNLGGFINCGDGRN